MTHSCPNNDDLLLLASGEQSEKHSTEMLEHVSHCDSCQAQLDRSKELQRGIAADIPGLRADRATSAVMRTIRGAETETTRPRTGAWQLGLASLVTAAAVLLVVVVVRGGGTTADHAGTLQPRGGNASSELARKVGAHFFVMREGALRKLTQGARISEKEGLTLSYVNAIRDKKVYMLAFVLDAEGEIHWLHPAYVAGDTDPEAIELRSSDLEVVLPETIVLEAPARGLAQLVWISSLERQSVSSIEKLSRDQRSIEALRKRWPKIELGHVSVRLGR